VNKAVDAAIGMMQNDEIPSWTNFRNIAIVWSVAGVMRPPTLRITAASPGARPNMSNGSTRGSTQPMIIVLSDGMILSSAEKRLLAKASLRWVKVLMTFIGNCLFWLRVTWLSCQ
jgi:hypothetical protein